MGSVGQSHIGTMKYRTQFVRNCEEGIYKLEINLNDLGSGTHEDGEILAHILWQKPTEFIPLCETALKELYQELISKDSEQPAPHIQLQFKVDTDLEATFGTRKPTMIRELTSDRVEELVVVQGIVVSAKRARHKARKVFLKCSNCENVKEITINSGFNSAHVPTSCLLFGGSRKQLPDGTSMRGDINVLLLGDPGTAKSQFLKFSEKAAPIAVYTSGKGSSAAGLTAAITKDANGFSLEGGAMVLADGGIVCIDEFDKMDPKDRVAIHEAMEQQTISIAKAGITTMLNTRCSVLAAANPRFGTYDDLASTSEQMDFESTILSRFDMMFLVRDVRDPERDFNLARHLAGLHKGDVGQEAQGDISVSTLRKYLSFCRSQCEPRISNEASEVLANHYISIRKSMKEQKDAGQDSGIPITVRQLEAIVRISESLAKMELKDEVDIEHVEEALRLFTVSTLDSANKDRGSLGDNLSEEDRDMLKQAEEQIRRRVARGSRISKFALEQWLVSAGGVEDRIARRAITALIRQGELVERSGMTLQREN